MKYSPGLMVGQLSGSTGSTTASHNRNGSYFRARTIPTNPRSTKQTTQRAIFATFSSGWRSLTDAQRAGWTALGAQMSRNDAQGNAYTLTGAQAYMAINRNLALLGSAAVTTAPSLAVPASLTSITITATSV